MSALEWLVPLLQCPACTEGLVLQPRPDEPGEGLLVHGAGTCAEEFPVIGGIPRIVTGAPRAHLVRTHAAWFERDPRARELGRRWSAERAAEDAVVAGFDYEWASYSTIRTTDLGKVFEMYFDLLPASRFTAASVVLDAGCGAGRWAAEVAARGPRVIAMDLGLSVEVAARSAASDRIAFLQGDVHAVPLRADAVDWAYSLGVLHHVADPLRGLRSVAHAVRSGGDVLIYLYYALDQRPLLYRALFRAVDLVRRGVSRLPRRPAHAVATAIAVLVYWPLARLSRVLAAVGLRRVADGLPLSFYRDLPFRVMRNDSLDRFGTTVEQRFTRAAMRDLLAAAGLGAIRFSPEAPFWRAVGVVERP